MSGSTCVISCVYQGKSEKSIKTHVRQEGKFFWLPLSQIDNIYPSDEDCEISAEQLTPGDEINVRIPVWLACKLCHCDNGQALEDLDLSYIDLD